MKETVHNLALSEDTGSLWYIDNESAFLDAYSLLYDDENNNGSRFRKFHTQMLKSSCLFRKKTVHRLFTMKKSLDPAQLLLEFVNVNEPLFQKLPKIHSNSIFRQHFSQRIQEVWNWIQECQLRVNYKPLKWTNSLGHTLSFIPMKVASQTNRTYSFTRKSTIHSV